MELLVRSWNVFHGNAHPPRRSGYLREMLTVATADAPDVLLLQELPVWALERLPDWTGMREVHVVTREPRAPAPLPRLVTQAHLGTLRSALVGQANAILAHPKHSLLRLGAVRVSSPRREPRWCLAARLHGLVVGNLHASNRHLEPWVPREEARRAAGFVESFAVDGIPVVLGGDFNVQEPRLAGYSAPGPGIDHVLVRGTASSELLVWPRERRMQNGLVLSDHAPVELRVALS